MTICSTCASLGKLQPITPTSPKADTTYRSSLLVFETITCLLLLDETGRSPHFEHAGCYPRGNLLKRGLTFVGIICAAPRAQCNGGESIRLTGVGKGRDRVWNAGGCACQAKLPDHSRAGML